MIHNYELKIKFNEKSANHAIKEYGYCTRLREFMTNTKVKKENPFHTFSIPGNVARIVKSLTDASC